MALRTEIELTRENLEAFIPGYGELEARLREDPTRYFFILANKRSQQTLETLRADLVTMPSGVLKAVIKFYTLDAEINQFLETLMTAGLRRPAGRAEDHHPARLCRPVPGCGGAGAQGGSRTAAAGLGLLAMVVGQSAALPARRPVDAAQVT